jgi:hypothetical protein
MVPALSFYALVLVALVWLFLMHSKLGLNHPATRSPTCSQSRPPRKRSNAPNPFAELTQKPSCALCEQDILPLQSPPPAPAALLPPTYRRSVRWRSPRPSAPIPPVPIGSGLAWGTSVPTAILGAARGSITLLSNPGTL